MEVWKPIIGFDKMYEVSSFGNIRSVDRVVNYQNGCVHTHKGKALCQELSTTGYFTIRLREKKRAKRLNVHRLVAEAFLQKKDKVVNHKNGVKTDNRMENLEWCSYSQNNFHSWRVLGKKSYKSISVECLTDGSKYESMRAAADSIGVSRGSIWNCLRGYAKTAGGKKWAII